MADTYFDIPAGFREQVSDLFIQSVQQNDSKFGSVGMIYSPWIATQQTFRITAPLAFTETTGQRGGDTQQGEYQVGYRSGFLRDFEIAIDFDINDRDRLYTANRPDSEVQRDMLAAWNRTMDDIFVDAAQELSYGGPKPYITPAASLPTSMVIPVTWAKMANGATNTNATIYKFMEALKRMQALNVDLEQEMVTIAISPEMQQAWLVYAMTAPNTPFAQMFMPWITEKNKGGSGMKFMGCDLIVSNRLKRVGSVVTALVFAKSAFRLSSPKYDLRIDLLPHKRHATQIAVYAKRGCMRLFDEKVNLIYADTSVDITY